MAGAIANAEVYRLIRGQAQELGQMLRHQKEESSKKQAMLTSIADGVVVNNTEGETIMVNPAAERILDTPEDQLTGRDFDELFSVFKEPGEMEAVDTMENLLSKRGQDISKAHKMVLEMDQRVINATLSPVQTQEGDFLGVVTILRDVTKEVEADRAKSQFISTVSHELRTPMTAIKGYTDLLHAGSVGSITDEQKRFLGIIRSNTNRLTALINDLLDISRVETGRVRFEPELMQIGDVIADVVTALAGQAESKDQTLTYEVDGGLPEIMGDWDRLNQVLTNLIGNAIHYTPEGGSVEVQAYPVENAVRVDVRDTGIGIASEDLARIFERFYRADHPIVQEARGTGLGLSIVKMFVEMHGGRVWVESEPGEGSTFTFILPLPVGREEKDRHTLPRLAARTRTVLVVDDERDVAELIGVQLEKEGYQIQVLGRGAPVVDWVEKNQPDLVILDLLLPDMDGVDVLRALKENDLTADIPVIVLTIVPDDGSIWKLGITDYITKPAEADELLESVEDALTWQGRVLIVEDHPDTVGMISTAMRQIGFTPLVAADGYEALMKARRYRPDLVLLDLRLPGMDGYEALTHFKRDAVTQSIPIVAISAHVADVPQERKRLIALGASSFLPKPFAIEDLLEEVETALQPVSGPSSL
jgi:PAS domain S-box-containing protein